VIPPPGRESRRPQDPQPRLVVFRLSTLLSIAAVVLGVLIAVGLVLLARSALVLIAIALFLALALNPAVEFFQHRGLGRGLSVAAVYVLALLVFVLVGLVLIPPLVHQVTKFIQSLPHLVAQLTKGKGPLGFLERKYHVVEKVRAATKGVSASKLTGEAAPALSILKGVATSLVGAFVIAFMTLFMLLEGPEWRVRITGALPGDRREQIVRVGSGVYRSVSGFVSGNLIASLIAGVYSGVILLAAGVPYALPLALFVVFIELVPYIGPLVVTVLLSLIAATKTPVTGLVVLGLLGVYHLVEGHTLRPLIYGHALKLSPLSILVAILVGTEVAGILGALAAIPVAGSIQVVLVELLDARRQASAEAGG
jgi:predicted PurR-regulated permease PerM